MLNCVSLVRVQYPLQVTLGHGKKGINSVGRVSVKKPPVACSLPITFTENGSSEDCGYFIGEKHRNHLFSAIAFEKKLSVVKVSVTSLEMKNNQIPLVP
jgi:hypothetical protein